MPVFERVTELPCSAARLFDFHAAPRAFARLSPPWDSAEVIEPLRRLANGERAVIAVGVGPAPLPRVQWVARHEDVRDGRDGGVAGFVDVAEAGPFSSWRHEHRFEPLPAGPGGARCRLVDRIVWSGPLGGAGDFFGGAVVEERLDRMFRFRHATTRLDLQTLASLPSSPPLVVGITGASGLIGAELHNLLDVAGHTVRRFVRRPPRTDDELFWDPLTGAVDPRASGLDAVVHLAGENIAASRLDDAMRARLRAQRVEGTAHFLASLAALPRPPRVVVSAAAIGYYGDRGDEVLDEDSKAGQGFLAELCAAWERAALTPPVRASSSSSSSAASSSGSLWRSVALRIGVVLSPRGGALAKALPPFLAGVGGRFGDGRAWMPLLAVDDVAAIVLRALVDERLAGVVAAVGPEPVRNAEFTTTLARVLRRPALLPVPRFGLRLVLGEIADDVLASSRVEPGRLRAVGHTFRHGTLEDALRHVLGRHGGDPLR
jgi:hypothetical protein